jgi:pimeloyl-ACP methyl ester carboxylesterase
MFARFRDGNAVIDSAYGTPGDAHLSGVSAESISDNLTQDTFHTLLLEDGRRLAWAEYGHPHGYPILYLHRQGGSKLEALFLHDAAKTSGFRLIAMDRPGLGGSDFFTFSDPEVLAEDYIQLINQLNLPQVAIFSWGSGSRFALSMAARFPARISFLNLLSPRERGCSLAGNRLLGLSFRLTLRMLIAVRKSRRFKQDEDYLVRLREHMCYADKRQLDHPEVRSLMARITHESTVQGAAGPAQDFWFALAATDIGKFSLAMPVHVWNGSADTTNRPSPLCSDSDQVGVRSAHAVIVRHWVHRQGRLFFRQAAGDIFKVTRQQIGLIQGAGHPQHR